MYFASISQFKKNRFSFQKGAGELQVVFKYCNIQIASSQLRTVFPGYAGRTRFQKTLPFQEVAVAICFPFLSPRMASLSVHLSQERRLAESPKPQCRSMSKRYNFFSYGIWSSLWTPKYSSTSGQDGRCCSYDAAMALTSRDGFDCVQVRLCKKIDLKGKKIFLRRSSAP